ncbi:hypothetical protein IWX75_003203 [Arthrobacter sp. CAN_A6]|uniref:hypothetical protein n=1 Tax=Arthrobacter sp. CAN_A6 TaxID=2787721 RepID=UPI0018CB1BF5
MTKDSAQHSVGSSSGGEAVDLLLRRKGRSSTPPPPNLGALRLAEVLRVGYHSVNPFHPPLKVGAIVEDDFYDELEQRYNVMPIFPSCLVNSVDTLQPQIIVIQRAALNSGPWFGTEDAAGGTLFEEIRRLAPWSRKRKVPVIFVDNGQPERLHTAALRDIGSIVFPSAAFFDELPEGPRRSHIYELSQRFAQASESKETNIV